MRGGGGWGTRGGARGCCRIGGMQQWAAVWRKGGTRIRNQGSRRGPLFEGLVGGWGERGGGAEPLLLGWAAPGGGVAGGREEWWGVGGAGGVSRRDEGWVGVREGTQCALSFFRVSNTERKKVCLLRVWVLKERGQAVGGGRQLCTRRAKQRALRKQQESEAGFPCPCTRAGGKGGRKQGSGPRMGRLRFLGLVCVMVGGRAG